jgi:uncharacterized protein
MESIIGREVELTLLSKIVKSEDAELLAIYGRRRVGKTFLIRNAFQKQMIFEFSGIHHATLAQQLENFTTNLSKSSGSLRLATPSTWIQAFDLLTDFITPIIKKQKKVIFFDEFPWINSPRSGYLPAFENFWNSWASRQKNLVVVICGSATSWMIHKVVNNRGGLHNRVTRKIRLLPFTIAETEAFLKARKVNLDKYQVLQLYMVMGGIPQYLKEIEKGESAIQAIDRICFTKDGLLMEEFKNLYYSLFDDARYHIDIIRVLASEKKGLTRGEIIQKCNLTTGGGATQILAELTESGFITPYVPFDRTAKDNIYKLTDEYSLFYIKFIENSKSKGPGSWISFSSGTSWKIWSGYAFESICLKHTPQLKKALGIENIYSETSIWYYHSKEGEKGAQIDLLIDRKDQCINICEMKFSVNKFVVTKSYKIELENKLDVFRIHTNTRKTLFLTLVTTYGINNSNRYPGLVQNELTMDMLFNN